jgi:hypothetical protein
MSYPFKGRLGDNVRRVHHKCRRLATVVPVAVTPFGDRRQASASGRRVKSTAERLPRSATRLSGLPKGFGRRRTPSTKRRSVEATGEGLRHDAERSRKAPKLLGMTPKGLGRRRNVSARR